MVKIERFEDMQSWQKAPLLANLIYDLSDRTNFASDFGLSSQIRDAAGSGMHNIAEGFESGTTPELIRFPKIARPSASETQSELYFALDRKHITQEELARAYDLATETKRLINGMIRYLRNSKTPHPLEPSNQLTEKL